MSEVVTINDSSKHSFNYDIADTSICKAEWGSYSGTKIPLTITGKKEGTTTITITDKVTSETKTIKVTVTSPVEIIIESSLPMTVYDKSTSKTQMCSIKSISFKTEYANSSDKIWITATVTGEKIYDAKGDNYSQTCHISYKLYEKDTNIVADSGTMYTDALATGDGFKEELNLYYLEAGKSYILKFIDRTV